MGDKTPDIERHAHPIEAEYGEQAYDYPQFLFNFVQDLKTDLQLSGDKMQFGPDYHLKTSRGMDVVVKIVYCDRLAFKSIECSRQKNIYFIALDKNGILLGTRKQVLDFFRPASPFYTNSPHPYQIGSGGTIATRFRGMGISTVIDLVNIDIMQKEINLLGKGKRLCWEVMDGNRIELLSLKNPSVKITDLREEVLSPEERMGRIKQKEDERERWLALYGALGKFGLDRIPIPESDGTRVFIGAEVPGNAENFDSIELERKGSGFLEAGVVRAEKSKENEKERNDRKMHELSLVMNQIQEILDKAQKGAKK